MNLDLIRYGCWNGEWEEHLPTACAFLWSPISLGNLHKLLQTNHNCIGINTNTGHHQNYHGLSLREVERLQSAFMWNISNIFQKHIQWPKGIASQLPIPTTSGRPFISHSGQTILLRIPEKVSNMQQNYVTASSYFFSIQLHFISIVSDF